MYKLFRSKKAIGVDDFIPLAATIIIFAIAFILLAVGSSVKEKKEKIEIGSIQEGIDLTDILLVYLQTPVSENTNFVDSIITSQRINYYEILERRTKKYFEEKYPQGSLWHLDVSYDGDEILETAVRMDDTLARFPLAEATLPSSDGKIIKVELYK